MKKIFLRLSLLSVLIGLAFITASAQEFQKSYNLGAGGSVNIRNVSGDINISGYNGSSINVRGFKEGRDRDMVDVEDLSSGSRVDVRARYEHCTNCSINASIRFEVQVPRSVQINFDHVSTASGNIELNNVSGRISVNTASGNVRLKDVNGTIQASTASGDLSVREAVGSVSAKSASGDVEVEITRLEGSDNLEFTTASGNVRVRLPQNLDADVDMSTSSGSIQTDFPIEIHEDRYGSQRWARGRLGSGSRRLRLSSASGDVSLMRF